MGLTVNINTAGLDRYLRQLDEAAGDAVRPAAQAGTQVIYEEVRKNVARISRSGRLYNALYQKYRPEASLDKQRASYVVSWNYRKAPHGILVEFGHLVRYEYYKDEKGNVRPKVRPERQNDPRPRPGSPRRVMDAYYVLRDVPLKVPPRPFIRAAINQQVFGRARNAIRNEIVRRINERLRS